ncbi:MAG: alpha/beta fold hydrolase, partial [Anaerolineales bacterium]
NSYFPRSIVMSVLWEILGWVFAVIFGLLTISMLLMKNWIQALLLFIVVLLVLPPVNSMIKSQLGLNIHPLVRIVLILGLLFLFSRLLLGAGGESIYKSPEVKAQFMEIYDEKMEEWPVPYGDIYLDTRYGKVHVIASGPEDGPAMLLLHASGVSGWSWKFNIEELSREYRTYAIDLIGDAGKSEFASLDNIMKDGHDQAELYREISENLDVDKAFVVGASEGGFIGSNYAIDYPERIEKLVLLGPMGYAGATQSVLRIMLAQFFPIKPIQESTFSWAFSDSPELENEFGEWFQLIMSGIKPAKVTPLPFSVEQRQSIQVPVLFVFGERDNLVGDPEKARSLVQDIPDVRVEVVDAGHLMGGELPEQVNGLILDFFKSD